jgi:hypothetical protein
LPFESTRLELCREILSKWQPRCIWVLLKSLIIIIRESFRKVYEMENFHTSICVKSVCVDISDQWLECKCVWQRDTIGFLIQFTEVLHNVLDLDAGLNVFFYLVEKCWENLKKLL